MKKRILASILSLVLVCSMFPVSTIAMEEFQNTKASPTTEEPPVDETVCSKLPGCVGDAHDPECPLYKAPELPPVEETVCSKLPGCVGDAHDPECRLYKVPELPPVEETVCSKLPGCVGDTHDPECPLYKVPELPPVEETVCSKLPGCVGDAHDPECPLYKVPELPPVEETVCSKLPGCVGDAHDPECPLYKVPELPPVEEPVCGKLPGCAGDAHDPECPLYKAPEVVLPEIPQEVQPFLDAVAALDIEKPNTIEAAWAAYDALDEEQRAREDVAEGHKRLMDFVNAIPTDGKVYVSGDFSGNISNGSRNAPYKTLSEAVNNAQNGSTIYVMTDLTITECARFYNKNLTITSEGDTATITRGTEFEEMWDPARGIYNPAMIEVQANSEGGPYGLTLTNIILDDNRATMGTYFMQAASNNGGSNKVPNTDIVQDAIVASNATVPCTITLRDGAVLQNFGGMSAVRVTDQAKLVMQSGSKIQDTTDEDRKKGEDGSFGPAGAVWIQGAELTMEDGAMITNMVGRAVYVDGGEASLGGTIRGIHGDEDMWQSASGVAIHVRGGANVTLTGTGEVSDITAPKDDNTAIETINSDFEAEDGSEIFGITDMMAVYAHDQGNDYKHKMLLNGLIRDCETKGSLMRSFYANITIGPTGMITKCESKGAGGLLYTHNGSQYTIQGKIIGNKATQKKWLFTLINGIIWLGNWGGGSTYATIEEGAQISNNKGYGIYLNGAESGAHVVMSGGEISENDIGIFMREKKGNHFIMNGGKITCNKRAGISHTFGNKTYIELNGGEIFENGNGCEISAKNGSADVEKNYLFLKNGVLKGSRCIELSFGKVTLGEEYSDIFVGTASDTAKEQIQSEVAKKGEGWKTNGAYALWFIPTTDTAQFVIEKPNVSNIIYAGYIPLKEDGTPVENVTLTLVQPDVNYSTQSAASAATLDIKLTGLKGNQSYALMLIKSPFVNIAPVTLYKYLTTDGASAEGDFDNVFPEPRYDGIPEDAEILVAGEKWEPKDYNNEPYPFAINYYEKDGIPIKDDSKPGVYEAKIEVLPELKATMDDITIDGIRIKCDPGALHILRIAEDSEIEELTTAIASAPPTVPVDDAVVVDTINALAFHVNNLEDEVPSEGADIRLLQDELLSAKNGSEDYYVGLMRQNLEKKFEDLTHNNGTRQYAMKYLEFIDVNDSNLIMTVGQDREVAFDLYLPYPDGIDEDTEFRVFNFKGLYRTYADDKDYGPGVEAAIENAEALEFTESEKTPYGIKVTVHERDLDFGHIGAMALTWVNRSSNPDTESSGGNNDDDDDEPSCASIIVTKVDEDGDTIKNAASFCVYKRSGGKTLYQTPSGKWSENRKEARNYYTRNGKFTVHDLKLGTYYIEEVKAPDGYEKANIPLRVRVNGQDVRINFENKTAQKPNPYTGG